MRWMRWLTEANVPRRIACLVMIPNQTSINRPWVAESGIGGWLGVSSELGEVSFDAGDYSGVAGDLGVPAAFGGGVAKCGGVGELVFECGDELGRGDKVVALLADVGLGTRLGC